MAAWAGAAVTPHDVVLCLLLRAYLNPGEEDPSPAHPLHVRLGEALLRELRGGEGVRIPPLFDLVQRIQVLAAAGAGRHGHGASAAVRRLQERVEGEHSGQRL